MQGIVLMFAAALSCTATLLTHRDNLQQQAEVQPDNRQLGAAVLAVDISSPVTPDGFQCLRQNLYNAVFIRGYTSNGQGEPDKSACSNIQYANSAGMFTEIYMTPQPNSTKTGAQQLDDMLYYLSTCIISFEAVWIQVTTAGNWSPSASANIAFLSSILSKAAQYGISIGIYTNANEWNAITGKAKITNARLWYWNNNGGGVANETPANFNDFIPFGGWSTPMAKQFGQSEVVCAVNLNRDIFSLPMDGSSSMQEDSSKQLLKAQQE